MNGYISFYNGKRYETYAKTLIEAHDEALGFFKPSKKTKHMVHTTLAFTNGETVIHKADV